VHAQDTAAGQLNEQVVIDARRAKPWPVALCTGGSGRGPAQLTIAGTQSPDQGKIAHLNAEKLFTL
jgi:hypothetical protein